MTPERIAELRALVEAASPGPWIDVNRDVYDASGSLVAPLKHHSDYGFDAAFIAEARVAIPELLDVIQRLGVWAEFWRPYLMASAPDSLLIDLSVALHGNQA